MSENNLTLEQIVERCKKTIFARSHIALHSRGHCHDCDVLAAFDCQSRRIADLERDLKTAIEDGAEWSRRCRASDDKLTQAQEALKRTEEHWRQELEAYKIAEAQLKAAAQQDG
jgi:hypothetical protein